jgi:O-antigen/teichoic acid export membrane protein
MSIFKIFKNSLIYGLGTFLINATGFLLIPFYTRFLSAKDYGIVSTLGILVVIFTTFYLLGQNSAVARFFFDYKDEHQRRQYFSTIWFFLIGFSLLISILLTFFGKPIFENTFREISFYPFGVIVIWTCFFSVFSALPLAIFRSQERVLRFSIITYLSFLMRIGLLIYFIAFLKKGAIGKLQAELLWAALFCIFFIILMQRYLSFRFSLKDLKSSLKFGLPLVPHELSLWSLNLADRIFLQYLISFRIVGIYALGYNLSLIVNFISTSIGKAWTPHFFGNADQKDAKDAYAKMSTYYTAIIVLVGLALTVLSKELVVLLSTPNYYKAAKIIPVAVLGYIFHSFYKVNSRILHYVKKTTFIGYSTVSAAILNIILNFILIRHFGMMGAAWATLISFIFLFCITFNYSRIFYSVRFEKIRIFKIFIIGLVIYYLSRWIQMDILAVVLVIKLILILFFPLGLYLTNFFTQEEKNKFNLFRVKVIHNLAKVFSSF